MGERTRLRIGTSDGVKTVRVYSANPKTADGYNTFIFRRDIARSLSKLAWAPVIDGSRNPVPEGIEVGGKSVRYSADDKRQLVEFVERVANEQKGPVENDDFGHFEITKVFATEVQCHAISTRREIESVSSAAEIARCMIHFVGSPNEEMKRKKPNKYFEYGLAKVRLSDGLYLVMGEVGIRANKRPYYDQRVVAKFKVDSEVTSLHGQTRIGESTFEQVYDSRFRLILQGVEMYYCDIPSATQASPAQALKQSPKFSIIIPVYNVAPYLRECLDSVVAQTFADWEAICVDDGSTDGSGAILDEYALKDRRVRVTHQKNAGVGAARNNALDMTKSEWVCFLDADDIWHRHFLSDAIHAIEEHRGCKLFRHGIIQYCDGEACVFGQDSACFREKDISCTVTLDDFGGHYFWEHVYHRDVIESVRFPSYIRGEDRIFFCSIVLNRCNKITISEIPRYGYRVRAGSAMNSTPSVQVLLDEMDHRCDLMEMCDASDKDVRYDKNGGEQWLERYFTDWFVYILFDRDGIEQNVLIGEWRKRLRRVRKAKRLSVRGQVLLFTYYYCGRTVTTVRLINLADRAFQKFKRLIVKLLRVKRS